MKTEEKLHKAIQEDSKKEIAVLLANNPYLLNTKLSNYTPIGWAIYFNKKGALSQLLTHIDLLLNTGDIENADPEDFAKSLQRNEMIELIVNYKRKREEEYSIKNTQDNVVNDYLCPISNELMEDPVVTADGHSYERKNIEEWFVRNQQEDHVVVNSPMTLEPLPNLILLSNITLKKAIESFREKIFIVNSDYQYEDIDINVILENRVMQKKLRNIEILAAVDNITDGQLEQRLIQEQHNNKEIARIVMIPCNLGGFHWVGILLEFFDGGEIKRAEYIDSLANEEPSSKLQRQMRKVYPGFPLQQRVLLKQNDSTSCGAYMIENLLLAAENSEASFTSAEKIRQTHLFALKTYNKGFYEGFRYRQLKNRPTVADIHAQLGYLNGEVKFSRQELDRILNIEECLNKMSRAVKDKLLESFLKKEEYDDNHASHLNAIRMGIIQMGLEENQDDREPFKILVKLLFNVEWQPGSNLDLDIVDFCLTYEEILAISKINKDFTIEHIQDTKKCLDNLTKEKAHMNITLKNDADTEVGAASQQKKLPLEVLCGICDKLFGINAAPVKCEYVDEESLEAEDMRDFHKECLTKYMEENVVTPDSVSRNISTHYTPIDVEEIAGDTICFFSKNRGRAIIDPVKTAIGICQKMDFERYVYMKDGDGKKYWKMGNSQVLLPNNVLANRNIVLFDTRDIHRLHRIQKDYAVYSKEIETPTIQSDVYKTAVLVERRASALLTGKKSEFDELIAHKFRQNVVIKDKNGVLQVQYENINEGMVLHEFSLWSTARSRPIVGASGLTLGTAAVGVGAYTVAAYAEATAVTVAAAAATAAGEATAVVAAAEAAVAAGTGTIAAVEAATAASTALAAEAATATTAVSGATATTAAVVTTAGIAVVVVGTLSLIFASLYAYAKKKNWEFSKEIRRAFNLYKESIEITDRLLARQRLEEAENILKAEFGEGGEGKYGFTRAARSMVTAKKEYAMAHLLFAAIGMKLQRDYPYREFENAYSDAADDAADDAEDRAFKETIKCASILSFIKLLSPSNRDVSVIGVDGIIEYPERERLLNSKIEILNESYGELVKNSFSTAANLSALVVNNIRKAEFLSSQKITDEFLAYDPSILRYMDPYGQFFEIVLTFMQGLCLVMFKEYDLHFPQFYQTYKSYVNNNVKFKLQSDKEDKGLSPLFLARIKFEECCILIKSANLKMDDDNIGSAIKEIKQFISRFFDRCKKEEIFTDDIVKAMVELGLLENIKIRFSEEDILKIFKTASVGIFGDINLISFRHVLEQIESSERMAKLKFDDGSTWLHYLPRANITPELVPIIQRTINKIISIGISPYERNKDGYTAFMCVPDGDPHKIEPIFSRVKMLDFIGVDKQIDAINNFLRDAKENIGDNRFLLLSGPPGVGKTKLVEILTKQQGFELLDYQMGDANDMYVGQIERRIKSFFDSAKRSGEPKCLFFDEMDAICPRYEGQPRAGSFDPDKVVTLIQKELDKLIETKVVVIGTTNYLLKIKEAIKNRASVIEFILPSMHIRKLMIEHAFRLSVLKGADIITKVGEATSGWSPRQVSRYVADVKAMAKRANRSDILIKDFHDTFEPMRNVITENYKKIVQIEPPKLKMDINTDSYDGLIEIDQTVKEYLDGVCLFLDRHDEYAKSGVRNQLGLILHGPRGTGKTSFARAIANNSNAAFIVIDAGKYKLPGSELIIEQIFEIAKGFEKAVVFIDEIDAITQDSSPAREIIQTAMDGFDRVRNPLVVIGATNYLNRIALTILDRAVAVEVPMPNDEQRFALFAHFIADKGKNSDIIIDQELRQEQTKRLLARESEGFSRRSISKIVEDAVFNLTTRALKNAEKKELTLANILPGIRRKTEEFNRQQNQASEITTLFDNHRKRQFSELNIGVNNAVTNRESVGDLKHTAA